MTMTKADRFWDRHAKGYAKRPVADEAAYQRKLEVTQTYFRPEMEVLEFGCGTGTTALIHAPFVKHIRAVDLSAKMLEIAQAKADAAGVRNVTFEKSDIASFSAPEASYDVVMAHSLLHLLEDKDAAIAKIFRLLKPGGYFVSSTVCIGGQVPWLRVLLPIGRCLGLLPLVKFFTPDELAQSLTGAGFRIEHSWQPGKRKGVFIVALKP